MQRPFLAFSSAALLLLITACGGSTDTPSPADAAASQTGPCTPTSVKVATLPALDAAPIYLGKKKGFFTDEGIDLTVGPAPGGSATIAAVISGENQFAYTATLPYMQARLNGLPMVALNNAQWQVKSVDVAASNGHIFVKQDSPVQSIADLQGKTIGVNALKGLLQVAATNALVKAGADPDKVTFVEVPFPSTVDALAAGQVDAIFTGEPYTTLAKRAGYRKVADPYLTFTHPFQSAIYATSKKYLQDRPDAVACFQRALIKSLNYATEHVDEARETTAEITQLTPDVIAEMTAPHWAPGINVDSAREQAEVAVKYGMLDKMPDIDEIFADAVRAS
ncbi:ABC transporter substrate-binding protein [Micromonospora radicis]|uniref:SsuA/THI5-like domain-containing protein n=1 Tax=Micromonospora radicis TaxID=1894971 RepID=A0A418MWU5_9ACTN|nr:ABC transporter substrate-binding protein [Micromonospora radicis]RIV39219.1 hypothetical protein D2L64_10240 [Micromonospora radicis]